MFLELDKNMVHVSISLTQVFSVTGKYTTHKIHTKVHPGLECRIFHILTSEDTDDIIFNFFTVVGANS